MAKTNHCPFTHKLCEECSLYRGRHLYISKQCNFNNSKEYFFSDWQVRSKEFKELIVSLKNNNHKNREPEIKVKVINMETEEERTSEFEELKKWNWSDPDIWRLIDGQQITSLNQLIEILNHKAEKGLKEVKIYEAPRFILLAGG